MRPTPPSVGFLSAFLLCFCLSAITAQHAIPQPGAGQRLNDKRGRMEARDSPPGYYSEPSDYYGNPPPYIIETSTSASTSASGYCECRRADPPTDESTYETVAPTATSRPNPGSATSSDGNWTRPHSGAMSSTISTGSDTTKSTVGPSSSAKSTEISHVTASPSRGSTGTTKGEPTASGLQPSTTDVPSQFSTRTTKGQSNVSSPPQSTADGMSSTTSKDGGYTFTTPQTSPSTVLVSSSGSPIDAPSVSGTGSSGLSNVLSQSSSSWSASSKSPGNQAPSSSGAASTARITLTPGVSDSVSTPPTTSSRVSGWSDSVTSELGSSLSLTHSGGTTMIETVISGPQRSGWVSAPMTHTTVTSRSTLLVVTETVPPTSSTASFDSSALGESGHWTATKSSDIPGSGSAASTSSSSSALTGSDSTGSAPSLPAGMTSTLAYRTNTSVTGEPPSSIRVITLTSAGKQTFSTSSKPDQTPTHRTGGGTTMMWTNSSTAGETSEQASRPTPVSPIAPTESAITLSITSTLVHPTTSTTSSSSISRGSLPSTSVISTSASLPGNPSTTYASEGSSVPSTSARTTQSPFPSSNITVSTSSLVPPFPVPENSTTLSGATESSESPWVSTETSRTLTSGSSKLPLTTTSPRSGFTSTVSTVPDSSPPYLNSTSGSWTTQPSTTTILRTVATTSRSRVTSGGHHSSFNTTVTKTMPTENSTFVFTYSSRKTLTKTHTRKRLSTGTQQPAVSNKPQFHSGRARDYWKLRAFDWAVDGDVSVPNMVRLDNASLILAKTKFNGASEGQLCPIPNDVEFDRVGANKRSSVLYVEADATSTWSNVRTVTAHNSTSKVTLTKHMTSVLTQSPPSSTGWSNPTEASERSADLTVKSSTRHGSTRLTASGPSSAIPSKSSGLTSSPLWVNTTRGASATTFSSETTNATRLTLTKVTLTSRVGATVIFTTVTNETSGSSAGPSNATSFTSAWTTGASPTTSRTSKSRSYSTQNSTTISRPAGGQLSETERSSGFHNSTATSSVRATESNGNGTGMHVSTSGTDTTCTHSVTYAYPDPESSTSAATCSTIVAGMTTTMKCLGSSTLTSPATFIGGHPSSTDTNDVSSIASNPQAGTDSYPLPTTFQTSVTRSESLSGSQVSIHADSTERPPPETKPPTLPTNANYPWGGDSPAHRHQNVTDLGEGIVNDVVGQEPQDDGDVWSG
ncbi:Uncharacterized protein TCAP_03553 [Tolypocladium capitatum]|uniref:Uncharacterized protein n=1 Tax=Tolypocladium capitatum TaxID=45235 RepID=A0A2K3QG91_9HYPO|nr:Uncharacterized protein TCAP_03553 [Tolypocladium capitatum]